MAADRRVVPRPWTKGIKDSEVPKVWMGKAKKTIADECWDLRNDSDNIETAVLRTDQSFEILASKSPANNALPMTTQVHTSVTQTSDISFNQLYPLHRFAISVLTNRIHYRLAISFLTKRIRYTDWRHHF